jgi:hypothetical protein
MADATAPRAVVDTPAAEARHGPLRAGDRGPALGGAGVSGCVPAKPKLLDQVRDAAMSSTAAVAACTARRTGSSAPRLGVAGTERAI